MWEERETVEIAVRRGDVRRRDFDDWVRRRLSDWPSAWILQFERWLIEEGEIEFVRAVRAALQHRNTAA